MGLPARLLSLLTGRPLKQRSPERQHQVDAATRQLSLYQFSGCPYCFKVRRVMRKLQLNIELRDATHNPLFHDELRMFGGKLQTPCLRIERQGSEPQWLYESADIIRYLKQRFAIT